MIKFAMVKFFRQDPYKKIVLSEEEAWHLGFQEKDGKTLIPSGGTLHHFVKYRLNVDGIDEIMMMVGEKISKLIEAKPQVPIHIDALLKMNVKINEYWLDGGYDSFENHADIWYKLKAKPLISLPIDAVINEWKDRTSWNVSTKPESKE